MAYRPGTQGMMQVDYEQRMDFNRMREYRVSRVSNSIWTCSISSVYCCSSIPATNAIPHRPPCVLLRSTIWGAMPLFPETGHLIYLVSALRSPTRKLNCPWIADYTFPAHGTMFGALPQAWKCY